MRPPIPVETTATTADWIAAISAASTTFLTLLLAIFALLSLSSARKALDASRKANEQMENDSIEQTRPYVHSEIIPSLSGMGSYDILIRNTGKSTAREVILEFSPWPEKEDDIAESVKTLMENPRDLPPGSSIRALWLLGTPDRGPFTDGTTSAGMPLKGSITLYYNSDEPKRGLYEERYNFDISTAGLWPTPSTGPEPKTTFSDKERLFYKVLRGISFQIGELRR